MTGRLLAAIPGAFAVAYLFGFALARSLHYPVPLEAVRAGSIFIILAWCLLCPMAAAQRSAGKAWRVIGIAAAIAAGWLILTWLA